MTHELDILPPALPGEEKPKKKGFFSRLFHHSEDNKEYLPPPVEEPKQELTEEKKEEIQEPEITQKPVDEHALDLDSIRKKLGLDEDSKTSDHLYKKLEDEANKDSEKEEAEYESSQDKPPLPQFTKDNSTPKEPLTDLSKDNEKPIEKPKSEFTDDKEFLKEANDSDFAKNDELDILKDENIEKPSEKSDFTKDDHFKFPEEEKIEKPLASDFLPKTKDDEIVRVIKKKKPIKKVDLTKEEKPSEVKAEKIEELPKMNLPEDENEDPNLLLKAQLDTSNHLNKIQKEAKTYLENVKKILLDKKVKSMKNHFILTDKNKLNSIVSMKKYLKTKESYSVLKESILNNKTQFKSWLTKQIKIQEDTEKALTNELNKYVASLYKLYSKKFEGVVKKAEAVKSQELYKFKLDKKNIDAKAEYLKNLQKELSDMKKDFAKKIAEHKKELETLYNKQQNLEKEKTKLKIAHLDNEKKRKDFYNKKHDEFNKWMAEQKKLFEDQKAKFESESKELKDSLLEDKRRYHELRESAQKEMRKTDSSYHKMQSEQKQFDHRKNIIEERLKLQENRLVDKINYNESLLASIAREKKQLDDLRSEIHTKGFANYVDESLAGMKIPKKDAPLTLSANEENAIEELISLCEATLNDGNLKKTKELYSQIRQKYQYSEGLNEKDKKLLYHRIRELYDDINLKILENDAQTYL